MEAPHHGDEDEPIVHARIALDMKPSDQASANYEHGKQTESDQTC